MSLISISFRQGQGHRTSDDSARAADNRSVFAAQSRVRFQESHIPSDLDVDDYNTQAKTMITLLYAIAAVLIVVGLLGAIVPALPGIPLIFGGIWLISALDHYRHAGLWWLIFIAFIGTLGLTIDLIAGVLGAKRVGASHQAMVGALVGTVIGLFLGLPGLLLGPFLGAVLGELAAGNSLAHSTRVGVGAWAGLIFGTIMKLVSSVTMLALFGVRWL